VSDHVPRKERWTRIATEVWAAIGILILLAAAGYLLSIVFPALVPFLIGLLIVLLLRHPVAWMEKRGLNRVVAVVACYLAAVVVVAILLMFIIPPIYTQIASFVAAVPGYAQRVYAMWDSYVVHPHGAQSIPVWLQQAALALRDQVVAGAGTWSSAIAQSAVSAGGQIASGVIGFVLALIVGFYTLVDLPRLRIEVRTLIGPAWREESSHVAATVSRVLGGWLRGTLIQSTVVAVLFTLGLTIAGVPYALAIGVIGGLVNVVPYVGPVLTAVLAAAAGWSVSPWVALWAVIAVLVVNQFDSLVMAPRIIGDQVDLHPLLVIFAFLVGATLFGLPGIVLAVPVAAVVKGLFVYWFERQTERPLATEHGVLFRSPPDDSVSEAVDDASDTK
jgi:predicted PurR-regulated permease PerM